MEECRKGHCLEVLENITPELAMAKQFQELILFRRLGIPHTTRQSYHQCLCFLVPVAEKVHSLRPHIQPFLEKQGPFCRYKYSRSFIPNTWLFIFKRSLKQIVFYLTTRFGPWVNSEGRNKSQDQHPSPGPKFASIKMVSSEYAFSRYTIITQCCFSVSRAVYT